MRQNSIAVIGNYGEFADVNPTFLCPKYRKITKTGSLVFLTVSNFAYHFALVVQNVIVHFPASLFSFLQY